MINKSTDNGKNAVNLLKGALPPFINVLEQIHRDTVPLSQTTKYSVSKVALPWQLSHK